jgi:hypothetical protein
VTLQVRLYPKNKISEDCNQYFLEMGDDVNVLALDFLGMDTYVLRHPLEITSVASPAGLKKFARVAAERLDAWLGVLSPLILFFITPTLYGTPQGANPIAFHDPTNQPLLQRAYQGSTP